MKSGTIRPATKEESEAGMVYVGKGMTGMVWGLVPMVRNGVKGYGTVSENNLEPLWIGSLGRFKSFLGEVC
jgi:hypothetical protein